MVTDPSGSNRKEPEQRWHPWRHFIWPLPADAGQPVRKLRPAAKLIMIFANVVVLCVIALVIWYAATR